MTLVSIRCQPDKTRIISPEVMTGVLGAFLALGRRSRWQRLWGQKAPELALEIFSIDQKSQFYLTAPQAVVKYLGTQITSYYPRTLISQVETDPLDRLYRSGVSVGGYLNLQQVYPLPLKTYRETKELPPLATILGYLAKLKAGESVGIQLVVKVPPQGKLERVIRGAMRQLNDRGTETASPYSRLYQEKLAAPLLAGQLRLLSTAATGEQAQANLAEIAGLYGVYSLAEGNSLTWSRVSTWYKRRWWRAVGQRRLSRTQKGLILNLHETASLWHLPDEKLAGIKAIDWGRTMLTEAPDNLPVNLPGMEVMVKAEINFFGQTEWHNQRVNFGIKRDDRRKHLYLIGKTGAGKSTLIANMAINDIRHGEGVAVIDPHGDLSQMILEYIPKRRLNDVVYLDPTLSEEKAFALNLFDAEGQDHTDVVASGIISVFYKLYAHSWGPRLEYILRNAILTLLYYEEATFADIVKLLTNEAFRQRVVAKIKGKDPVIAAFWEDEFARMNDRLRVEAISPILNKVGQFISSRRIRQIVGSRKSTFSLETVMNQKKILLLNLAQGKLGEDTTALLGAMFITKIQLTAMRRVHLPEEQRQDFYLYVDEFQNFATHSFIKILSEARKYRLNLVLANQYIGQVDEEIQKAIFGNVGSTMAFVVGARDAALLEKEFGGKVTAAEMVALGKYELLLKLAIDGLTSEPFTGLSLPLPAVVNRNKAKIIALSLEHYYHQPAQE
ncbi:hypothetical protein A2W24_02290 [Microgenomates group bacterium RBG_16_45_19]|nr:MAG: hypothetical protein A2W24_02290 [Microgenomates group bacterium RBG_16_45_19]